MKTSTQEALKEKLARESTKFRQAGEILTNPDSLPFVKEQANRTAISSASTMHEIKTRLKEAGITIH